MTRRNSIVRDIQVSVSRVDEEASRRAGSTAYVFSVRPVKTFASSRASAATTRRQRRRRSSIADSIDGSSGDWRSARTGRRYSDSTAIVLSAPLRAANVHEVARTYAQCRSLYGKLLMLTDCKNVDACCCILGSCPFWSMYGVIKAFPFPRKALLSLQWTKRALVQQRLKAFNAFMATICQHFQLYRDDFFLERSLHSADGFHGCSVLGSIEAFLELTPDVVEQLRSTERVQLLKPNLQGWESDRKNLYFYEEAAIPAVEKSKVSSSSAFDTQTDSLGVDVDEILRGLVDIDNRMR